MTAALATLAKGDGSAIVHPRRTIARDPSAFAALWAAHAGPEAAPPPVDFATRMVAAVFAGERPTPGHAIEITGSRRDGSALELVVREVHPGPGLIAPQLVVTPFHIVTLPRQDGEVRFVDVSGAAVSGAAAETTTPSSTGLDPNLAAALAYLAGPFSGLLILLVERGNDYVRFHAWQSILGLGALGLLSAATLVFSFLTLLLSPFAFTLMYRLSEVIAVVWLVAWLVCLVKASTGKRWEMPVAGRYATRLATRPF